MDGDVNKQCLLGISRRAGNQTPSKGRGDAFREITPLNVTGGPALQTARHRARICVFSSQYTHPLDYQAFDLP